MVTLFEITRYLQDMVPAETAPHSQMPFSVGDLQAPLNPVNAPALAALIEAKTGALASMSPTGSKGLEEQVLASADASTRERYAAFKAVMQQGKLLDPPDSCASDLYRLLIGNEQLQPLRGLMTRELAVALINEAQQALNALLNDDPYEQNQWVYNFDKYDRYPEYLARAIELLGEKHYMYKALMAKQLFFEARKVGGGLRMGSYGSGAVTHDSLNQIRRSLLAQALHYEPDAAYLYYGMANSWFYDYLGAGQDSFLYYIDRTLALSPTWVMPRIEVINKQMIGYVSPEWQTCLKYISAGLELNPDSYILTERLAWVYQRLYRMDEAIALAHKMTAMRPDLPNGYATLGTTFLRLRQYDLAEDFSRKALAVDSTFWGWPMLNILQKMYTTRQYETCFRIALEFKRDLVPIEIYLGDIILPASMPELYAALVNYCVKTYPPGSSSELAYALQYKGKLRLMQGDRTAAKALFLQALPLDPTPNDDYTQTLSYLGEIAAYEQHPDSAELYFQQAIHYYYPDLFGSWIGRFEHAEARYRYARFLTAQNRPADAEAQLKEAEQIDPRNPLNYYGMAALHAAQKYDREALDWLSKALEWYYPDYDEIMAEPLFKKIRKTKQFKALMKQYFPDGSDRPKVEALAREYMPELFEE
ncbi:MAG: hypothetical protein IPJ40_10360 [Saprospirales bacterium]|nr:hypothetical protein [Saprospirales bacterium]